MTRAPTSRAVVERRHTSLASLDYFPTPPWATRALVEKLSGTLAGPHTVWEPAAGGGHMAEVLRETNEVFASDVHDYGIGHAVGSFVGAGVDVARSPWGRPADWIITNPPFKLAAEFVSRAVHEARVGCAMLVRTSFLEGVDRHRKLYAGSVLRPRWVFQFAGRVPMTEGRWDPEAKTATAYAWMVWLSPWFGGPRDCARTELDWIDPNARKRLTRPDDAARFAGAVAPCAIERAELYGGAVNPGRAAIIEGPF